MNFSSIKANVAFEESYGGELTPGTNEEVREAKFEELLDVCNDKLDAAILAGIRKVKILGSKD